MTEKANNILEKLALDFGTTRGLITALKAGGASLVRTKAPSVYFKPFVGNLAGTINITKGTASPRAEFFHEMGHFLDLRKRPPSTIPNLMQSPMKSVLKTEQHANIIANKNIVNPEHKKLFADIVNQNYKTYKRTLVTRDTALQGLSSGKIDLNKFQNAATKEQTIADKLTSSGMNPAEANKITTNFLKRVDPQLKKGRAKVSLENIGALKQDAFGNYFH
jgi:hypothetical protein